MEVAKPVLTKKSSPDIEALVAKALAAAGVAPAPVVAAPAAEVRSPAVKNNKYDMMFLTVVLIY